MMSTSLLERQESDGAGQRHGNGFNQQPAAGLRRTSMFRKTQQIHLVGIGGAGMSGIAEVLLTLGYKVTGSDLQASDTTRRLEELGGRIFIGHQESNVGEAQVVVISSAVSPQNPEVVAAKAKQIPVIPRAEMLAELMRLKFGVAIAGAHGKTTTTSMVANVLAQGGLDPTMVIGGKVNALGSHARLGRGELLVAEADESDGSFLRLSPTIVAVTNLDREHLDHYGSMERIAESFLEFINKVPFYGLAVLCADDERLRALFPKIVKRYQTYGLHDQEGCTPDFRATEISPKQGGSEFRAFFRGRNLGPFRLSVPGIHNVSNALIAIAIGVELDVPVDLIRKALAAFTGVERRFHLRGEAGGIMVVDDYGHHPTEIKATLAAAKQGWSERRLVVLFQPHRYTRTRDLLDEFSQAFKDADHLFLTEIYAASEQPIPGVSGAKLAEAIRAAGHPSVTFVERKDQLIDQVLPHLKGGDLVLTLGAGDIWKSGTALLGKLASGS
jgi:UDP-N-acetylmuramate--alanine ligase